MVKLLDKIPMSMQVGLQHLFWIIFILGKFDTLLKPLFSVSVIPIPIQA